MRPQQLLWPFFIDFLLKRDRFYEYEINKKSHSVITKWLICLCIECHQTSILTGFSINCLNV